MRAVNLQSICPFSLGSLVAYNRHEQPHCPAPPAKQAKQREPAWQSSVTASGQSGEAGNSTTTGDRIDPIPQLAPQLKLTGQWTEKTAVESARPSRIPG